MDAFIKFVGVFSSSLVLLVFFQDLIENKFLIAFFISLLIAVLAVKEQHG